jgi:hypothetical protein
MRPAGVATPDELETVGSLTPPTLASLRTAVSLPHLRTSDTDAERRDETLALPPEEQPVPPSACPSQANADSRF